MNGLLALDLRVPLERFTLAVAWETSEPSLGIFGPSGAGKTTILEAIAGLRKGASGRVRVGGQVWLDSSRGLRLPPERRGVGYVPQEPLLFPQRDVLGNLLAGRRRAERAAARRLETTRVLEILELTEIARRPVAGLSGGEQRRVTLGRALCSAPEILLLDEPLTGLGGPLRRKILGHLLRVRDEFSIPTIVVSHEIAEIRILCNEIIVLDAGRVAARGRPEDLLSDPSGVAAAAEAFENVLTARVVGFEDGAALAEIEPGLRLTIQARGLAVGQIAAIGIRAEEPILALSAPAGLSAQNCLPGTIGALREPQGEGGPVLVSVEIGRAPARLVVAVTRRACRQLGLRSGLPVHLIIKAQACRLLAER